MSNNDNIANSCKQAIEIEDELGLCDWKNNVIKWMEKEIKKGDNQ